MAAESASGRLTLPDLIEELRQRYGATSDEKLAFALQGRGVDISGKTIARYRAKAGEGKTLDRLLALLEAAGYLSTARDGRAFAPSAPDLQEEIADTLKDLVDGQAEILRRLPPSAGAEIPPARPKPKRT